MNKRGFADPALAVMIAIATALLYTLGVIIILITKTPEKPYKFSMQEYLFNNPETYIKINGSWYSRNHPNPMKTRGVIYLRNKHGEGEAFIKGRGVKEIPNTGVIITISCCDEHKFHNKKDAPVKKTKTKKRKKRKYR